MDLTLSSEDETTATPETAEVTAEAVGAELPLNSKPSEAPPEEVPLAAMLDPPANCRSRPPNCTSSLPSWSPGISTAELGIFVVGCLAVGAALGGGCDVTLACCTEGTFGCGALCC